MTPVNNGSTDSCWVSYILSSRAAFSAGPSALYLSALKSLGPALKTARDDSIYMCDTQQLHTMTGQNR